MILEWTAYNESIATKSKLVAHGKLNDDGLPRKAFFRHNNLEEASTEVFNGASSPFVVIGGLGGQPVGKVPTIRPKLRTRTYFLSRAQADDVSSQEAARQLSWNAMMQFVTRYINDHEETGMCGPFSKLDTNKMSWQEVGPMLEWEYGYLLEIEFLTGGEDLVFDPQKWTDHDNNS